MLIHHAVKGISQETENLCWKACAEMLFTFKFGAQGKARFESLLATYAPGDRGLPQHELRFVYRSILGLKSSSSPRMVIPISPLIWTRMGKGEGHAMILVAYDTLTDQWVNWNPYETISATAGGNVMTGDLPALSRIEGKARVLPGSQLKKRISGPVWYYP